MDPLLRAMLQLGDRLPAAAFTSTALLDAWIGGAQFTKSVEGTIGALLRSPRLPSNLPPSARDHLIARLGRTYGTAVLVATQDDPELLAEALRPDAPVTVRTALVLNPHLPNEALADLRSAVLEYMPASAMLAESRLDFLCSTLGVSAVANAVKRYRYDDKWQARFAAFVARYPVLVPHWIAAGINVSYPPTLENARLALSHEHLDILANVIAAYLHAEAQSAPDTSPEMSPEVLKMISSLSASQAVVVLADIANPPRLTGDAAQSEPRALLSLLADRILSLCLKSPQARSQMGRKPHSLLVKYASDPVQVVDVLLAPIFFGGNLLPVQHLFTAIENAYLARPDIVALALALAGHPDSGKVSRATMGRTASALQRIYSAAATRLVRELSEIPTTIDLAPPAALARAEDTLGALSALLTRADIALLGPASREVSSDAVTQALTAIVGPEDALGLLSAHLSAEAQKVLAGYNAEWRAHFSARLGITDYLPALSIASSADRAWITETASWEAFFEAHPSLYVSDFWAAVAAELGLPAPSSSSSPSKADHSAATSPSWPTANPVVDSMLEFAPPDVLAEMPADWTVDVIPPSRLPDLVDHYRTGPPKSKVHHVYAVVARLAAQESLSTLDQAQVLLEIFKTPSAAYKDPASHSLLRDLAATVAATLGSDSAAWDLYASMSPTWTGDPAALLAIVTNPDAPDDSTL